MFTKENAARRFESDKADKLFELLNKHKKKKHQYARRYKKRVEFYSIESLLSATELECKISGPDTSELLFVLVKDLDGFYIRMRVGVLSDENVLTMNRALKGLLSRVVKRAGGGGNRSTWNGYYLSVRAAMPDEDQVFEEAIRLGLMSHDFVKTCKTWGITIERYPKK